MKKQPSRSTSTSNEDIAVHAALSDAAMLRSLVSELASRRYDTGSAREAVQPGWQALDTSSIEAYASGVLYIRERSGLDTIHFDACFTFTCIRAKDKKYNLTWASSLS